MVVKIEEGTLKVITDVKQAIVARNYDEKGNVIDEYGFSKHPISKFVNSAQSLNVNFVFFNNDASKIASGCGYVIKTNNQSGIIVNVKDKNESTEFL